MNTVLYSCRIHTGNYAQDLSSLVLLMNDHCTKDTSKETLFQPDDPWISHEKDIKSYILQHLDIIKLSRS